MPPQRGRALSATTQGPLNQVPCPACGAPNDFTPHHDQQLLDTGSDFNCDKCGRLMQVAGIRQVVLVVVRPSPNAPKPPSSGAPRAVGTGVFQRLLGRGR